MNNKDRPHRSPLSTTGDLDGIDDASAAGLPTDTFVAVDREWRVTAYAAGGGRAGAGAVDEPIGRAFWSVWPGGYDAEIKRRLGRAMAERVAVAFRDHATAGPAVGAWRDVHAYPSDDGLMIFCRDVVSARSADGAPTRASATAGDPTKAELAEERLRRSEERTRLALEDSPVTVYQQDADLRYVWVHNLDRAVWPNDVVGRTDFDLLPEAEAAAVAAFKRRVMATGVLERHEVQATSPTGLRVYDLTAEPVRDGGAIVGVTGVAVDVTDRRRREERIAHIQALTAALAGALEPADVAAAILDQGLRATGASSGIVTGLVADGRCLEMLGTAGYQPASLDPWRRFSVDAPTMMGEALRTRAPVVVGRFEARRHRYPFHEATRPIAGDGSGIAFPLLVEERAVGALCLGFDEERAFAADELALLQTLANLCAQALERARLYRTARDELAGRERSESERRDFVDAVAHDLKNPLAVVKAQAQLVARRLRRATALDPDALAAGLATIESAAERAISLIDEMLDAARLREGLALDLGAEPVDLVALVQEVVDDARRTSGSHVIRLDAPQPVTGVWDRTRLERVLANILANAVKYSPKGGGVVVRVERRDGAAGPWVELSVADRGVGIPAADLPHVFERYHRGRNVAGRIAGTGIGLAGARQIVEQHGGTIVAESVEGQGSTFTVRLPLGADHGP